MTRASRYILVILIAICSCASAQQGQLYNEPYRPQIHFSPPAHWMNDPNGMVYYKGSYHLFYQYYPGGTKWGPMHWGHATSNDLIHWHNKPIALYPDSHGYIFSGSVVADVNNTSGFGKKGRAPLVAIFTQHDAKGEKSGSTTFQNQSIAFSLDEGKTWRKYDENPVLRNPGIKDFRDPKVSWYAPAKKWIMTLATLDKISFYSSKDLKEWKLESEFGQHVGAHGGVWECPDLFQLDYNGKKVWILIVNLNPGGPNAGSATQYFTGEFDGHVFKPFQTDTRWLDYGPDEYAGVTWANTGKRKIFLGWMSNWLYGEAVPTGKWRSAMTIPRELALEKIGEKYLVTSQPIKELRAIETGAISVKDINAEHYNVTSKMGSLSSSAMLQIEATKWKTFTIVLSNNKGEQLTIGYDKANNNYFIDRSKSGDVSFYKGFAARHTAPRLSQKIDGNLELILDEASVELFADNGLTVMTEIFFPTSPYTNIAIQSPKHFIIDALKFSRLKSIWR